jgi:polyisoprenoid-binding protein YceI
MRHRLLGATLATALCLGAGAQAAWATTYTIDKDHTTLGFKIRHLFSQVQGTFDQFEGTFVYVPGQPETWKASATIQAGSINTKVEKRDTHLRSPDFFHVEQYPTLTFTSTQVTDVTPASAKLHGNLTIHGVAKPVVFDLEIHGEGKDPWGNIRSGFTATTTINRKDFGLTWNQALETGQLLVGEDVAITLEVEGIAQG